ncbi:MAG TPA: Clp protease N-terminal domain-containing protein, partial [Candidatus Angelobacter sp.]|nr:Clp protease N-terminal domain-containing protein [Candidatus Angelobacter sp.]
MFERYTEKARRVIFFARYEASQFGSPYIETEHLLLGLLREDKALTNRFLHSLASVESIRKQIEQHTLVREKVSTSVDLPLSNEGKRVLAYAAEEAERLSHKHIGTEHLLLGLLREEKSFAAAMLQERGVRLSAVREELARGQVGEQTKERVEEDLLAPFTSDLTQQAAEGRLQKIVERNAEMKRMIQVLGRANKRNPVLAGERGAGRRSLVAALAQQIAGGEAPEFIAGKRIVELDLAGLVCSHRAFRSDFAGNAVAELMSSPDVIFFVPDLFSLVLAPPEFTRLDPGGLLKVALAEDKLQCIASATP